MLFVLLFLTSQRELVVLLVMDGWWFACWLMDHVFMEARPVLELTAQLRSLEGSLLLPKTCKVVRLFVYVVISQSRGL